MRFPEDIIFFHTGKNAQIWMKMSLIFHFLFISKKTRLTFFLSHSFYLVPFYLAPVCVNMSHKSACLISLLCLKHVSNVYTFFLDDEPRAVILRREATRARKRCRVPVVHGTFPSRWRVRGFDLFDIAKHIVSKAVAASFVL